MSDEVGVEYAAVVPSPVGALGIVVSGDQLAGIDWVSAETPLREPVDGLARTVAGQLNDYFADPARSQFDLPLVAAKTPFQERIRDALQAIPAGEVRSYGELARMLNSSARAVGGACRSNPVPLVVPCHRVVASHGLGGFGGALGGERLAVKQRLLEAEGVSCTSIT